MAVPVPLAGPRSQNVVASGRWNEGACPADGVRLAAHGGDHGWFFHVGVEINARFHPAQAGLPFEIRIIEVLRQETLSLSSRRSEKLRRDQAVGGGRVGRTEGEPHP